MWFGYVTGGLLCIPAFVLMFLPYLTGDWHSSNMEWNIGTGGGLPLALVWLYFMCWSSYGICSACAVTSSSRLYCLPLTTVCIPPAA